MEQIQFIYFQYCKQYYFPSQRKQHIYGNLASWMMVQAPPTTASLFWFYYNCIAGEMLLYFFATYQKLPATVQEKDSQDNEAAQPQLDHSENEDTSCIHCYHT